MSDSADGKCAKARELLDFNRNAAGRGGIKRLQKLEEIATGFDGVEKCFAIQAGREIRIMVKPDKVSDDDMTFLARDIAKRIEDELEYPGQIRVMLIRENRQVDYAK